MRLYYIYTIIKALEVNFVIVGYRGYGPSQGSPNEIGIKIDGEAIAKHVFENMNNVIDTSRVFFLGKSLGGAVATHVQAKLQLPIQGIILENTFTSMADMIRKTFPIFYFVRWFILRNHWETKKIIGSLNVPILFIMSDKDEIVPYEHMQALHNLAQQSNHNVKQVSPLIIDLVCE